MIILALDQSITRAGYAVIETGRRSPQIVHSGWFASKGGDDREKVDAFAYEVQCLILDTGPRYLVWEKPARYIAQNRGAGVNAHQLILTRLDEQLVGLARKFNLASETVAPASWRSKILGKGAGRLDREQAKKRALSYCKWIGVPVRNDDQAEAICIGLWAAAFGKLPSEAAA